jgi:lipoprotein NlpD
MKSVFFIGLLALLIVGCASHTPAPVINRSPQATAVSTNNKGHDWRPSTYTVKKGDTLYSIGLEYGYDYREIADANNIYDPYTIKIGQTLNFSSLNKETANNVKPTAYENESGVIISPIDVDTTTIEQRTETAASSVTIPRLVAPKAVREPYSKEAFNRVEAPEPPPTKVTIAKTEASTATQTTEMQPTANPVSENVQGKMASSVLEGIKWSWPTQGKVSATFNAANNKGIDIVGQEGQPITAAADGKVIYTGSDLRGYGKLVIIKHSNTLLSVYAHNSKINIKEGQLVKAGQKIAEMGNTDTDKTKLHFEIRQKGQSVDPALFLPKS